MNSDLQQRVLYHQVQPQSEKTTYTQFDQCSFLISVGTGRSLLPQSVRVLGDIAVLGSGTRSTNGRCWDKNIGAGGFIDSISVQTQNQGLIENIQNYPRYVAMDSCATLNELDMLNSINMCELKTVNQLQATKLANGIAPTLTTGTAVVRDPDFSVKPLCCVNKMSRDLPFDKTGIVTLQLNLQRDMTALFGSQQDSNTTYEISNLRVTYKSIADPQDPTPTEMGVVYNVKSNILSGTASISANVPAVCDSVAVSFIQDQHDSVPVYNSYKLENVQGLEEVQYLFNDSTNSLIAYVIRDQQEMVERFLDSISNSSHNQVSQQKWRSNDGFALGLNFEQPVDLSTNRFTMQIGSSATNLNQYPINCYMYFFSRSSV
tara:strand:+ start:797 stop:1921 length:1125 start_codon:yes stop_codon:yes gene_type:complete